VMDVVGWNDGTGTRRNRATESGDRRPEPERWKAEVGTWNILEKWGGEVEWCYKILRIQNCITRI
jgi:hypothetical protein